MINPPHISEFSRAENVTSLCIYIISQISMAVNENIVGKRGLSSLTTTNDPEPKKFKPSNVINYRNAGAERFPDLVFVVCSDIGADVLICTQKDLRRHTPIGLISRVKLIVEEDSRYDFQVIMISKEKGRFNSLEEFLILCEKMTASSGYKFCPGFNSDTYHCTYFDHIQYDLRRSTQPLSRIDSQNCLHVAQTG